MSSACRADVLKKAGISRRFLTRASRAVRRRPPASSDRSSTTPSAQPSSASLARSGCGMRPTTLPASLLIPAMSSRLPLGFCDVAHHDAVVGPEPRQRLGVADVVALEVVDRDAQDVTGLGLAGEHRARALDLAASTVSHRNLRPAFFCSAPGSRPGLAEHLEAVADPDDRTAGRGELGHRVHHRREPGDRAGAEVVAVREAAGHHHRVDAAARCGRRARGARPSPPSCSTAHTTSSSQFVPGNTTTPTRALTRARSRAVTSSSISTV